MVWCLACNSCNSHWSCLDSLQHSNHSSKSAFISAVDFMNSLLEFSFQKNEPVDSASRIEGGWRFQISCDFTFQHPFLGSSDLNSGALLLPLPVQHSIGNWAQTYKLTTLPQEYPTWISKGRPSITMFFGIPGMCFKISTGVVWWLFVCLFLEFYWTDWTIYVQKNWNLFSVNVAMAATGIYQLSRKIR